ncbi:MAG: hypothetical protein JW969_10295 [Spirochaetales bacterium]|nr:hypothetical protein [Spirochaetales bacterium]
MDIYLYDFDIITIGTTDTKASVQEGNKIFQILQKELAGKNNLIFNFKSIPKSQNDPSGIKIKSIKNTLDALGVSFLFGIDYLLFGDLTINKEQSSYSVALKVYNREKHDIIYNLDFSETIKDPVTYAEHLAEILSKQISEKITGRNITSSEIIVAKYDNAKAQAETIESEKTSNISSEKTDNKTEKDTKTIVEENKVNNEELKESVTQLNELINTIIQDKQKEREKEAEEEKAKDRQIIVYVAGGAFFNLMGDWSDTTLPFITADVDIKYAFPLAPSPDFDFYLRLGIGANYAQSRQNPSNQYIRYIRINSIIARLDIDTYFFLGKSVGLFISTGPSLKYMTIDFTNSAGKGIPGTAYTFGAFGALGVDWIFNNRAMPFGIGIKGIADLFFFSPLSLDIKLLAHFVFKI